VKDKIIKFSAQSKHVFEVREKPKPASSLIPQWWKDIPHYSHGHSKVVLDPAPTVTVKRCLSAYDAIASGYIVTLWTDIEVTYDPLTGHTLKWLSSESVFSVWDREQSGGYEIPEGFDNQVFKYQHGWRIETPKGYSSLIIHPTGYQNLPFKAIPGIVDTDVLLTDINMPIVFKKGWEGILEKGTPMFQIIPVKRDEWSSEFSLMKENEHYLNVEKLKTKIVSSYARYMRTPKKYT
jgi:hypothetical protein